MKAFSILFLLFWNFYAFAQFEPQTQTGTPKTKDTKVVAPAKPTKSFKDNLVLGGGLDVRFGDYTVVGISPLIGYRITEKLLGGFNLTYRYFENNLPGMSYSTSTYGIAPFLRYQIYGGLFAHVEYEAIYGEWDYQRDAFWIDSFFVGGGYMVPIGNNGFFGLYLLWNLTEDPNYIIYSNPVVRTSFGFGF
jgi:hypothetical protein